jgi:diguanylate cyclase (GGDEF)-like protein/PAS domain S-box-containing protein
MPDLSHFFISQPDSSLLLMGSYDPFLVVLSLALSIFAAYAALLVGQHIAGAKQKLARRIWSAIGGICLGLGVWAMHFVGMLALSLPCASSYDTGLTLLSMIPSFLASTLALTFISRPVLTRHQFILCSLLLGAGAGAMHYTGMAALQIEGLIRYDFVLFGLSLLVAVALSALAIWLKFHLHALATPIRNWASVISASVLGLSVSGMHYTAMAAAYFLREADTSIADNDISITFLASTVVAATGLIILVTIVASYLARPKLFSLGVSYRVVGVLIICWIGISWVSASYYGQNQLDNLYKREMQRGQSDLDNVTDLISENLRQLQAIPLVFAHSIGVQKKLADSGPNAKESSLSYKVRKELWTNDRSNEYFNQLLKLTSMHFRLDAIWLVNAAGDCIISSNFDQPESFVGTNYKGREYFQQAKSGVLGQQYAVGLVTKLPGLFYAYPVMDQGRFLGAVVVKSNISNFSSWINKAQAFVTDANGVVVLTQNPSLQFRALPNAKAFELTEAQKKLQYGRVDFNPMVMTPWGAPQIPQAIRLDHESVPVILLSKGMASNLITVHVARPLNGFLNLRAEKNWLFVLIAIAGSMLMLAAWAVVIYLRESRKSEDDLRIAATAFDSNECMMITDANCEILRVNKAFTFVTGFNEEEMIGKTPGFLKSSRHEASFYEELWNHLRLTGSWQGEIWDRRKNGDTYPSWFTITAVKDKLGKTTHFVGMATDITRRKSAEEEIAHLAFYDSLTRLPNRRLLIDRLQQALATSARNETHGALLFIDLDNFKTLNDTMGHDIGDLLLKEVAERLITCVREVDTVARLGGDEFVVMLEDLNGNVTEAAAQAQVVGEKILTSLNQEYELSAYQHHSTPSIGITLFRDLVDTVDELLKRADLAMYQAKASGRNTLRFFDPNMQATVNARAGMESDLREAIRIGEFELYYQSQTNHSGQVIGAEALLRWRHPKSGMVLPSVFIPLAEDTGLIHLLGKWVLATACVQLRQWARNPETAKLTLAVNVSQRQFHHPDFVSLVLSELEHSGANPRLLKLELTESLLADDVEATISKMSALKVRGIGFALDDFGTGYSSLSYLKRLPLDQLKIDQSFVRDVFTDANDAAIVKTIVALGQSLGLEVMAEGVETEAQRSFLASQGCHSYQGYLFGRPVPIEEFYVNSSTTGA